MDQNTAMLGGLFIGIYTAILFLIFSHKIGAFAAFGRRPLENEKFICLAMAAFLPGVGCLGSLYLTTINFMLLNPILLAVLMASIGIACRHSYLGMERYLKRQGLI